MRAALLVAIVAVSGSPVTARAAATPRALPDDPLDVLWTHRLDFAPGGAPLVTVRLMEGQREVSFRAASRG